MLVLLGPTHGVHERHIRTGDRCGSGAAVSLQYVAVDLHLVFAERLHVDHTAQAASDQSADFVRASADLAAHGFAIGAVCGGSRQHRIFCGDPAQAGVLAPTRYACGERGRAHYARIAAFHEHGPFRNIREAAGDAHWTQLIHLTSVRANYRLPVQHVFNRYHR